MHAFFRAIALGAAVSLSSSGVAAAAAVDSFKPSPALNFTKIPLANGENVYCRKAGGTQWQVFIVNRDGKQVPAPPGLSSRVPAREAHVSAVQPHGDGRVTA